MRLPLQKITLILAISFVALLGLVLVSGVQQYFIHRHYIRVLTASENLIFQFSNIRDHINDSIIKKQPLRVNLLIPELQSFNSDITKVLDDVIIPDEYKLGFISQIDISGIVILLRELSEPSQTAFQEKAVQLSNKMRLIQERLVKFDRVMVNHARTQLVRFQNTLIGGLAIIIFVISIIFFLLNRGFIIPYLGFIQEIKNVIEGKQNEIDKNQQIEEFSRIASIFNELIYIKESSYREFARQERLLKVLKRLRKVLFGAKDKIQLFAATNRALLLNEDYCLIWIGEQGKDHNEILPVAADACTSMDERECQDCMEVLLTFFEEQGLEFNPSAQTLMKKRPLVFRDILKKVPKGLLKNTPLASGVASCASLPILVKDKCFGVINIYSVKEDAFGESEMKMLEVISYDVAIAIDSINKQGETIESGYFPDKNQKDLLIRLSRLSSLGELAAGFSYEINNLTNGIINLAQVMLDKANENGVLREEKALLAKIVEEGEKIADLEARLFSFAEVPKEKVEHVAIDHLLQTTSTLLGYHLKKDGIELKVNIPDDIPAIKADFMSLQCIFLNLISNAISSLNAKYPEGCQGESIDVEGCLNSMNNGNVVRISILDKGLEFEKQFLDIFSKDIIPSESVIGDKRFLKYILSRLLIKELSGEIRLESEKTKYNRVDVFIPVI